MDYKKVKAEVTTVTRDLRLLEEQNINIYEAIVILSKRANQISLEMKDELNSKLADFATHTDNLEEIFENREQIEISKYYEHLPKPTSLSISELLDGKVYYKKPQQAEN